MPLGAASSKSPLPTIRDVARLAGVSKTTASDALKGTGRVSQETRSRVEAAAATLGYRPHAGARDLTRRRSEVIGLLVGDMFDPFVAELTGHLENQASSHGFRVLLATAGVDLQAEQRALTNLIEHRVAALILVAYGNDVDALRSITGHTPVVSLASSGPGTSIGVDDVTGALLAVDHLLELGHTRIAYLSGALLPTQVNQARFTGYRAALRRATSTWPPAYKCSIGPRSDPDRLKPIRDLLTATERPTAFFAASDVLALELIGCADSLGLRVPDDLSVVGFDDMQFAGLPMISLTTVAQPAEKLAHLGVEAVLAHLTSSNPPESTLVEPALIVRGSTAGPPTGGG